MSLLASVTSRVPSASHPFLLLLLAALLGGLLIAAPTPAADSAVAKAEPPAELPNIVIFLTDDQRVRTMSRMPNLWSQIRQKGVTFPEAGAPTSLCCPARATLLTGLYAHSTRVFSNGLPYGGWQVFHDGGFEDRTIATALDGLGYHTALVGKYMNGGFPDVAAQGYVPPGWDDFVTFTSKVFHYEYSLSDGNYYGSEPEDYATDVLAGHAVDIIKNAPQDQPLFLYFSTVAPHRPFMPAPRHVGAWAGRLPSYRPRAVTENVKDKPWWIRKYGVVDQKRIDADMQGMQEMLMSVDEAVGSFVQALTDTGRMDNTLFIFLSDNGLMLGEHHLIEWKNVPYRWSTNIPLIMRWDGHITPNSTDERLALNVDVATTISAATGAPMVTEGLDLLGPVQRAGYPLEGTRYFSFDSRPEHPAYCGYRNKRWMFIQYNNGSKELYDYENDPQELHNRARTAGYEDKVARLRAKAMATCTPTPPDFAWQ